MDIKDIKAERGRRIKDMKAIFGKAEAENRALTTDEQTQYDRLNAEQEEFGRRATLAERQAELDLLENTAEVRSASPRVEVGNDLATTRPWNTFGEQLLAIRQAAVPGGSVDPRLRMEMRSAAGMAETPASDGGFLVLPEYSKTLLQKTYEAGAISSRVTRIPTEPQTINMKINYVNETSRATGSRWGGIRTYWAGEGGEATASKPKLGQLNLSLKKLIALCYATDEMLQDASALAAIITKAFIGEMGYELDESLFCGDGVAKPLGLTKAACVIPVAKESAQSNYTIVANNIIKMWARCYGKSRMNAVWYINQDIEPQLPLMYIATGTSSGYPIYLPPGGVSGNPYGTLYGRPVIPIEHCPTLGTEGDIVLADPSQMVLIDREIQAATSMHVRFIYDESAFRFVYRVDAQPSWPSALTPAKGSNTLSPFITLADRK